MGVGYKVCGDGTVIENYWEQIDEEQEQDGNKRRRPYRIELVGVVCDAYLAVIRGIRYVEYSLPISIAAIYIITFQNSKWKYIERKRKGY